MQKKEFIEQLGAYSPDLKRYVSAYLKDRAAAEDVLHDCLLQALNLFDRQQFDEGKSLKNWLFCVAYSRIIDYLRHQARCHRLLDGNPAVVREALGWENPTPPLSDRPHQSSFRTAYARSLLKTRFADLPVSDVQRQVLQLRYIDRLSYRQIADYLHAPLSTVVSRHAYAMRILRGDYVAFDHRVRRKRTR